jgi:hypothetical protein
MKIKTSSKKVTTSYSRRIALLGCALLALGIFAPAVVEAVPITLSLDNPNQSVAHPSSGTVTLAFTGTTIIEPGFAFGGFNQAHFPFNFAGTHFLNVDFSAAFVSFFNDHTGNFTGGTFTGTIFNTFVTPGDPPALYAFDGGSSPGPAQITLTVVDANGVPNHAIEAFSVRVTGVGVPDRGSSILLLGLSLAAVWSFHTLKRVAA